MAFFMAAVKMHYCEYVRLKRQCLMMTNHMWASTHKWTWCIHVLLRLCETWRAVERVSVKHNWKKIQKGDFKGFFLSMLNGDKQWLPHSQHTTALWIFFWTLSMSVFHACATFSLAKWNTTFVLGLYRGSWGGWRPYKVQDCHHRFEQSLNFRVGV